MRLKLIFLPWNIVSPITGKPSNVVRFPPLGIAMLTGYLRKHGLDMEQDDLSIKVIRHNEKAERPEETIHLPLFSDEVRIERIMNGRDDVLEAEAQKMLNLVDIKGFDVIGFSLHSSDEPSVVGVALALGKLIKEITGATVIIGGGINRAARERLLESDYIDCEVESSHVSPLGEINLLRFCRMVEKGVELYRIPGTVHVREGRLVSDVSSTDEERRRCFFTVPDFDGLPLDLYRYSLSTQINGRKYLSKILILPYLFIYGCPYRCAYCTYAIPPFGGTKDPEQVARDLEWLSNRYDTRYYFFFNTEINPTKKYAMDVAEELIKRDLGILWSDCATIKNMDVELLEKLREAGAARLVWGVESGSPSVLNYVKKNIEPSRVEMCLREGYRLGIWNHAEMICGFPFESDKDTRSTISFLRSNKEYIHEIVLNKFFLEGLIAHDPEKYGIRLKENKAIHRTWATTPFDEINGLHWEERIQQTTKAYDELVRAITQFGITGGTALYNVFQILTIARNHGISFDKEKALEYADKTAMLI